MRIKNILSLIFALSILYSCQNKLPCTGKEYSSNSDVFIASGNSLSSNEQMAADKALFDAKTRLSVQVNDYVDEKFKHPTLAPDPAYFKKLENSKKSVLQNIEIICEKSEIKREKYYSYIAISISKKQVEEHVKEVLKQKHE